MWEGLTPAAAEQSLAFQLRNPPPPAPPVPSFWSQVGEIAASVPKGLAQGANESLRAANRITSMRMQQDPPERRAVRIGLAASPAIDEARAQGLAKREQAETMADEILRDGAEYWRPDPVAATMASRFLQDGARIVGKAVVYGAAGGLPGAVVGTGTDEGVTTYLSLRDKGVDPTTAAQVGAVRGVATGVGVAIPAAGRTVAQTVGLVAAGGPALFMGEQALTRQILEEARYPELAAQYDPFDPVGLAVSALVPGAVGALAHRARGRAGQPPAPDAPPTAREAARALADEPDMVDAAHVAYREQVAEAHMLATPDNLPARAAHAEALQATVRALDDDQPVPPMLREVDPVVAARVVQEFAPRLRALEDDLRVIRQADAPAGLEIPAAPLPVEMARPDAAPPLSPELGLVGRIAEALGFRPAEVAPRADGTPEVMPETRRAQAVAEQRPDLPIRLDDNAEAMPVRELLDEVRQMVAQDKADSRAFVAAVECVLRTGG